MVLSPQIRLFARVLAAISLVGGIVSLTGCGEPKASAGDALRGKLVLTGSSTVAPIATEIARAFEALHPAVRVDVQSGGSSRGIADASSGLADIGMASRALKPDETARGLVEHPIAIDGIAVVVHADNPIASLTFTDVVAIYRGDVERWRDVGGADDPIVVVHKAEGRATQEVFLRHYAIDPAEVAADLIVGENQHALKTLAGSKHAIGYVSVGEAEHAIADGAPLRMVTVDGITPSLDAVSDGTFAATRPLNLITAGAPRGLADRFLQFARSETARALIQGQRFAPTH